VGVVFCTTSPLANKGIKPIGLEPTYNQKHETPVSPFASKQCCARLARNEQEAGI
jgi:hypothetical protein